jgi:foldase protein PrsA
MILDIVGQYMKDTRDSVAAPVLWTVRHLFLVVLASLLLLTGLVACSRDGEIAPTSAPETRAIVVSTVEPTEPPLEATSTPAPPTPTNTPEATSTPTPPAPAVAVVNGRYLLQSDFERQLAQYEPALLESGIDLDSAEGQAALEQARRDVLESMIDHVLIQEEAEERGLALSGEELAAMVAEDIESGGGQEAFDSWLVGADLTRDDYARMLGESLVLQRVWDAITADVAVERDQIHARHITVTTREEAQAIRAQLEEGADFVALAREHSLDEATAENGGDLGWFPRGTLPLEVENVAFGLQPGQVDEAFSVDGVFHVIQVLEREVARPLDTGVLIHFKQQRFDRWLAESRAEAEIERFVGD